MVSKEIDGDTLLPLPKTLEYNSFGGSTLVLAPECGNFLGLFNAEQVAIFTSLQQHSINEAEKLTNSAKDFHFVVGQILDREFFDTPLRMYEDYDTAQLYLTNACNLSCPHCYMSSGKANANELDGKQWCAILSTLARHGTREVILSGGEIMLHKDAPKIIKHAKGLGLIVSLKSNGTLFSQEMVEDIAPHIDDIQISLDGISEEMNAKIRGKGSFEKALFSVGAFIKNGVEVTIATTPTYENLRDIEEGFVEFASGLRKLYGEKLRFIISQKMLPGRGIAMRFDEGARDYARRTDALMDRIYPSYQLKNLAITIERKERVRNCGYGSLTIASNGRIYLCNRVDELQAFATVEEDFASVLQRARSFHRQTSVDAIEPCKHCSARYICGGGCRIDEYHFKGRQEQIPQGLRKHCSEDFRQNFKHSLLRGIAYIYEQ